MRINFRPCGRKIANYYSWFPSLRTENNTNLKVWRIYVTCRHEGVLEERRKMLAAGGFVRPLTGCLHDAIVAAIGHNCNCHSRWHVTGFAQYHTNYTRLVDAIVPATVTLSNWSQSHWPAKWCDTWNVEQTLKLLQIVKKNYPILWQTDHKEYRRKVPHDAWRCCEPTNEFEILSTTFSICIHIHINVGVVNK